MKIVDVTLKPYYNISDLKIKASSRTPVTGAVVSTEIETEYLKTSYYL